MRCSWESLKKGGDAASAPRRPEGGEARGRVEFAAIWTLSGMPMAALSFLAISVLW